MITFSESRLNLLEARLPDVMLDLHDVYGNVFPKPQGDVILFTVFDKNTTSEKAAAKVNALLAEHGVSAVQMVITPGPEEKKAKDRKITVALPKDDLM